MPKLKRLSGAQLLAILRNFGFLPVSQRGLVPAGGGIRTYQCWYRNANPTFCTPATSGPISLFIGL